MGPEVGGVDRGGDLIAGIVLRAPLGDEARRRADPARFAAAVLGDEVRRDAVEPRARVLAVEVVGRPLLERDPEHLAEQRVRFVGPDATDEIAEQRARMAVEQRAEGLRARRATPR